MRWVTVSGYNHIWCSVVLQPLSFLSFKCNFCNALVKPIAVKITSCLHQLRIHGQAEELQEQSKHVMSWSVLNNAYREVREGKVKDNCVSRHG